MPNLCIDYGHYGQDSGATYKGRKEVDIVKIIADELQNILRAKGNNVFSSYGSFENRIKMCKEGQADLFISIHLNATLGATGNEVLISKFASDTSKNLAKTVLSELTLSTGLNERGVRVDVDYLGYNLYVLRKTTCPAILIECGFIEKDWENKDINLFASVYAHSIAKGILKHLGQLDSKCAYCGK